LERTFPAANATKKWENDTLEASSFFRAHTEIRYRRETSSFKVRMMAPDGLLVQPATRGEALPPFGKPCTIELLSRSWTAARGRVAF
jgi:hypothetical protein